MRPVSSPSTPLVERLYELILARGTAAALSAVALAALLASGLDNLARAFATVKPSAPFALHLLAAVSIELGVIALGLVLAVRARETSPPARLRLGVIAFVIVSMLGNFDTSAAALLGGPLTAEALAELDAWTITKAAALGASIPVLVLFVLEGLQELAQARVGQGRGSRAAPPSAAAQAAPDGLQAGPEALREMIEADPSLNVSELARLLGCSRPSIYRWAEEIGAERNGGGRWEI